MTLSGTDYTISGQTATSNGGASAYVKDGTALTLPSGVTPQVYLNGAQVGVNTATTTSSQTVYQMASAQCSGTGGLFYQTDTSIQCTASDGSDWSCATTAGYGLDTSPSAKDYASFDGIGLGITGSSNWYLTIQGSTPVKIADGQAVADDDVIKISWSSASGDTVLLPPPYSEVVF
jgi:hypothetical protein